MSEFKEILLHTLAEFDIELDDLAVNRLCTYNELLIEWNEKINLTALTAPEDVALKHFTDSLMLLRYIDIEKDARVRVIDVGTGAGFPGLVLKIARPDIRLTLLDKTIDLFRYGLSGVGFRECRVDPQPCRGWFSHRVARQL